MDYILKTKQDLLEQVVFYGDANIYEHRFLSQQQIDFDEASHGFIGDNNDIIFEEVKTEKVSFEEQKQRDIFIRMFSSTKFKIF